MKSLLKYALLSLSCISAFYSSTGNAAAGTTAAQGIENDANRAAVTAAFDAVSRDARLTEYLTCPFGDQPIKLWNQLVKPALEAQHVNQFWAGAYLFSLPTFYQSNQSADLEADDTIEKKIFYLYNNEGEVVFIEVYTVTHNPDGSYTVAAEHKTTKADIRRITKKRFSNSYSAFNPLGSLIRPFYIERANRRKWAIGVGATTAVIGADLLMGLAKKADLLHIPVTALAYARYGLGKVLGFGLNNTLGRLPYVGGLVTGTTNWYENFTNPVWFSAPQTTLQTALPTLDDAVKMVAKAGSEGVQKLTAAGVKIATTAAPIAQLTAAQLVEQGKNLAKKTLGF